MRRISSIIISPANLRDRHARVPGPARPSNAPRRRAGSRPAPPRRSSAGGAGASRRSGAARRGRGGDAVQLLQDVVHRAAQGRAVADQLVAALVVRLVGQAGHGKHRAALLGGMLGGDEGARLLGGLHDHHDARQAGDDAVAGREQPLERLLPHGAFGHQRAVGRDPLRHAAMLGRVEVGQPAGQHGHGAPAGLQGRGMGDAVDAARHAGDHGHAGAGQPLGEARGHPLAVGGGMARADQGHAALVAQVAAREEQRRRAGGLGQRGRVAFASPGAEGHAGLARTRQLGQSRSAAGAGPQGGGDPGADAGHRGQGRLGSAEDGRYGAEMLQQGRDALRADAGREQQGEQPGQFRVGRQARQAADSVQGEGRHPRCCMPGNGRVRKFPRRGFRRRTGRLMGPPCPHPALVPAAR